MMELKSLGIIAVILLLVKFFLDRAKSDTALSDLKREDARKKAEAYAAEVARTEQEIQNAKIRYDNARRDLDKLASESSVPGTDPEVPGSN